MYDTCISISFNNRAKHILHVSRNDVIVNVMFCFDEAVNFVCRAEFLGDIYKHTYLYYNKIIYCIMWNVITVPCELCFARICIKTVSINGWIVNEKWMMKQTMMNDETNWLMIKDASSAT